LFDFNHRGSFISANPVETCKWAEEFSRALNPGDAIFLIGELGAGKTVIAQGIIRALGFQGVVSSPSFTFMKIYHTRFQIFHCDLFRLNNPNELAQLGMEEVFDDNSIAIFEWGEKYPMLEIVPRWEIKIVHWKSDNQRRIMWEKFSADAAD
jgi:tRNA threonylcarbamoyl adenosine modification protein YjeE